MAHLALNIDSPIVLLYYLVTNVQSQSGAIAGWLGCHERVKHFWYLSLGDSDALIFDTQSDMGPLILLYIFYR